MTSLRRPALMAIVLLCGLFLAGNAHAGRAEAGRAEAAAEGLDGTHRFDDTFREWAKQHPPRFALPTPPAVIPDRQAADLPGLHLSCERVFPEGQPALTVVASAPEKVGDVVSFWYADLASNTFERTEAVLTTVGTHCRVYVEKGQTVSPDVLQHLREEFDTRIVATVRQLCGAEKTPGIDGDPRLTLLLMDIRDGVVATSGAYVAGYFYPGDQYAESQLPPAIPGHSNQRDMLYLDISQGDPEHPSFLGVVAHELQHLIHFHHDSTETTWINEGCSQAAARACGSLSPRQIAAFTATPDNSLVQWKKEHPLANYGQATLWMSYLLEREAARKGAVTASEEAAATAAGTGSASTATPATGTLIRDLVADPRHGVESLDALLVDRGLSMTSLFADFVVALTWNDPSVGSGNLTLPADLGPVKIPAVSAIQAFPGQIEGELNLWSGEAIRLDLAAAKKHLSLRLSAECRVMDQDLSGLTALLCWETSGRPVAGKPGHITMVPYAYAGYQSGDIELDVPDGVDGLSVMLVSWVPTRVPEFFYARQDALWYRLEVKDSGDRRPATRGAAASRVTSTSPVAPNASKVAADGAPHRTGTAGVATADAENSGRAGVAATTGAELAQAWLAAANAIGQAATPDARLSLGDRMSGLETQLAAWTARELADGREPDLGFLAALGAEPTAAGHLQSTLQTQITGWRLQNP